MVLTIIIDWTLTHDVFFLALILVSSKAVSSYNEAPTFLYQKQ